MTTSKMKKRLAWGLALGTAAVTIGSLITLSGCELAVDFDRTKIDAGPIDAAFGEGGVRDAQGDSQADTGSDAGSDGGLDGSADGSQDAGDAATDADASGI